MEIGPYVRTLLISALSLHFMFMPGFATELESPKITDCVKISPCICETSNLGVVDLTPLANTDGTPKYSNVPAGVETYSWNPCNPFTIGTCHGVAACQRISFTSSSFYSLGSQESAKFIVDNDGVLILSYSANTDDMVTLENLTSLHTDSYHYPRPNFLRTAYVKLICDASNNPGRFVALGEDPTSFGNYHFTLTSIHACPDRLKPSHERMSLSVGSCMLITLSVVLALYISIGLVVQLFVFKKSGSDVFPNKTLWVALPGLIKDGTMFIIRRGKRSTYEEFK